MARSRSPSRSPTTPLPWWASGRATTRSRSSRGRSNSSPRSSKSARGESAARPTRSPSRSRPAEPARSRFAGSSSSPVPGARSRWPSVSPTRSSMPRSSRATPGSGRTTSTAWRKLIKHSRITVGNALASVARRLLTVASRRPRPDVSLTYLNRTLASPSGLRPGEARLSAPFGARGPVPSRSRAHRGQRRSADGEDERADQLEPEARDRLRLRVDEGLPGVVERADLVYVGEVADQEDQQRDQPTDGDRHRRHLPELLVPRSEGDQNEDEGEDGEHQGRVAVLVLRADRLQSLAARRGEMEDVGELRRAQHRRGGGAGEDEQRLRSRDPQVR